MSWTSKPRAWPTGTRNTIDETFRPTAASTITTVAIQGDHRNPAIGLDVPLGRNCLPRRDDHDLNQETGREQSSFYAGSHWRVSRVRPLVPSEIVLAEHPHVRQPDLSGNQLGFITAHNCEQIINLLQDLSRLIGYITDRIGSHTLQKNKISESSHATDDGL